MLFIAKLCFTNLLPYLSVGVDSSPGRFFRHQYGSNWTLYYAAADKDYQGVLCNKISSSHTTAMQERFRQEQCTWQKDNSTFGGKFWKTGSVADARKGQHRSSFGIIPENIQNLKECLTKSSRNWTRHLSRESVISRASVLRNLHDDVKLFSYKIQILRRQADQNKAEGEIFCEGVRQRIENDSGLLDLNNSDDVSHCGLCGASATLSVFQNLAIKR